MWPIFVFLIGIIIFSVGCSKNDETSEVLVTPVVETSPTISNGANRPLIWIHPTDIALSIILGADGKDGLELYDLKGNLVEVKPADDVQSTDLRYYFPLKGQQITLIAAHHRSKNTIGFYTINPETRQLISIAQAMNPDKPVNQLCLYHSPNTGKYYIFLIGTDSIVQQWELFQTGQGSVNARQITQFEVQGQISHCIADDQYGHLYLVEENAILKYSAEPQETDTPQVVDTFSNLQGLTLYYAKDKQGYLIASNPNDNNFLIYQRGDDNRFLGRFTIIAKEEDIDSVEESIGIAVTNHSLDQTFTKGLFVVQDTQNTKPEANANYKLVHWEQIANPLGLISETDFNSRQIELENETHIIQQIQATVETEPMPVSGDAADDIAIWIHPEDPALSTLIGTQKQGGLVVYDLTGQQLQYLPDGRLNNVDLRYHFPLGDDTVTLVAASHRSLNSLAFYTVNPRSRQLENIAARTITIGLSGEAYGLCLYHQLLTNKYYAFVNNKQGQVEQWEIFDNGTGQVDATLVRSLSVGSQTEGCVVDDEYDQLYIGEENVGIWKYQAQPEAEETRTLIDTTEAYGYLTADVEGLTIYNAGQNQGYLIASSQGNNAYVIYDRTPNNTYLGRFQIVLNEDLNIDGTSETDGIDVIHVPLGTAFPYGIFVAQDGRNTHPVAHQNFKLVPWEQIADAFGFIKNTNDSPR